MNSILEYLKIFAWKGLAEKMYHGFLFQLHQQNIVSLLKFVLKIIFEKFINQRIIFVAFQRHFSK